LFPLDFFAPVFWEPGLPPLDRRADLFGPET